MNLRNTFNKRTNVRSVSYLCYVVHKLHERIHLIQERGRIALYRSQSRLNSLCFRERSCNLIQHRRSTLYFFPFFLSEIDLFIRYFDGVAEKVFEGYGRLFAGFGGVCRCWYFEDALDDP